MKHFIMACSLQEVSLRNALRCLSSVRHAIKTTVQSNLAKGRIAVLSPLATVEGFTRICPCLLLIHGSADPHKSANQTASRSIQPFLHSSPV